MVDASDAQQLILDLLNKNNEIPNTADLVSEQYPAQVLDAALKSLNVDEYVQLHVIEVKMIELSEEGRGYAINGTPEY